MIPWSYHQLARMIHEERIREAQARRPEWMYAVARPVRRRPVARASRQLRISVAQALRRLAASVEGGARQPAASVTAGATE